MAKGEFTEELRQIKQYIAKDFMASVVGFLVGLPLCMGIAIASGVPPALGILSGIIGGLVVSVIGGSPLLVSGPQMGLAVIVWELVREHGVMVMGPIVLMAGILQMLAGAFRMGLWFRVAPPAVIYGIMAGIGVSVVANQLCVMMDAKPGGMRYITS